MKEPTYTINTDAYTDITLTLDGQPIDTTYNISTSAYTSDFIFDTRDTDVVITIPQDSMNTYSSVDYYGDIVLSLNDEPDQER